MKLAEALAFRPAVFELAGRYNHTDHDLEKIVVGNEPAVSGGLGSQVNTHKWRGTM
jgi:hypothetical protein